jgi:serine phosphatase RsbU (regulator of sigma subunit)
MGLQIDVAIAKTGKYVSRESGDTAEFVERPGGGLSIVVVDGQGSGQAAKAISSLLSARAVGLIKDGVRDGVVARAVHDQLFAYRHGQVSATLDIVSVDLRTKSVLVTRNAGTPVLIGRDAAFELAPCAAEPLGLYLQNRPAVWEVPIEAGLCVVACTDGVANAGERRGRDRFDLVSFANANVGAGERAAELADVLLGEAIRRDDGRPADDMTVVVLAIGSHEEAMLVRRQTACVPLP